jgi:chemotaxis protein methyltransferase CheR
MMPNPGHKPPGSGDRAHRPAILSQQKKVANWDEIAPPAPITSPLALPQVTDDELQRYADLVYRKTGIRISPQKKTLLSNRLRRRLRETGISSYSEYYDYLTKLPSRHPEWDAFLQEITTHETYLFRDELQWQWFRKKFLAEVANRQRGPMKTLRIWSAACSTGDEAFTAACCIAAELPDVASWRITILGTDIGVGAVEQARTATFGERAMRLVPDDLKRRFFEKLPNAEVWRAKPILTQMTTFRQHNLMEPLPERPFDLIFLKNVLIYFDMGSKKVVLNNVLTLLQPGGYLVVGAAEGVGDLLSGMTRLQPWLYQKPQESGTRAVAADVSQSRQTFRAPLDLKR